MKPLSLHSKPAFMVLLAWLLSVYAYGGGVAAVCSDSSSPVNSPDLYKYFLSPDENPDDVTRRYFFVRASTDKQQCYEGEPVTVRYMLYKRVITKDETIQFPAFDGFLQGATSSSNNSSTELINGEKFNVSTLYLRQLMPLLSGQIEISPIKVSARMLYKKNENTTAGAGDLGELFDRLSSEDKAIEREYDFSVRSKPLKIDVQPVPATGRPQDFNGGVGQFSIKTLLSRDSIKTGDLLTVTIIVRGHGNLALIDSLVMPEDSNFRKESMKISADDTDMDQEGVRKFEYVYSVTDNQSRFFPPVVFSFFNPSTKKFETIRTQPVELHISGERMKKPAAKGIAGNNSSNNFWIAGIAAMLIAAGAGYSFFKRKKPLAAENLSKPVAGYSTRLDSLDKLENPVKFYTTAEILILEICAYQLKIPYSDLVKKNIVLQLKNLEWDQDQIGRIISILQHCEANLYIPQATTQPDASIREQVRNAVMLLNRIDREQVKPFLVGSPGKSLFVHKTD